MGAVVGSAVLVSSKGPGVSWEVESMDGKEMHVLGMLALAQSLETK